MAIACGISLLAVATCQPLSPRSGPQPVMGDGWKFSLVTLLLLIIAVGVRPAVHPVRRPITAMSVTLAVAIAAIGVWSPLSDGISTLDLLTDPRLRWEDAAGQLALPVLACTALFLQSRRPMRHIAAGVLLAVGVVGYLSYLRILGDFLLIYDWEDRAPGRGVLAGLLGSLMVAALGMLLLNVDATPLPRGRAWFAGRLAAGYAVIAILGILVARHVLDLQSPGFTPQSSGWAVPVLLGLAGVAVCSLGSRSPGGAAGALVVTGCLTLKEFLADAHSYTLVYGQVRYPFEDENWLFLGDFGLSAGAFMLLAGLWGLLAARAVVPTAEDEMFRPSQEPSQENESRTETGRGRQVPGDLARTEATRYLSAAPYFDDRFARDAVRRVFEEDYRAVAPSVGIDLGMVLRHCVAARRLQRVRDVALALLLLPVLLILVMRGLGDLRTLAVLLASAWAVVLAERWSGRYRLAGRHLTRRSYDPGRAPRLNDLAERRIVELEETEAGNVSVYGDFNPFVGSGWSQGGWSFALNTAQGKTLLGDTGHRLDPRPFDTDELYDAVQRDVTALDLDDLVFEDCLYVDGMAIRDDGRFVTERTARPRTHLPEEELGGFRRDPELGNRVYRCIRVHAWEGEFVFSVFLNFRCTGRALFAEVRYFLLTPVKDKHVAVDRLEPYPQRPQWGARALVALPATGRLLVLAVPRCAGEAATAALRRLRRRQALTRIDADPTFNYGATTSVRELAQSPRFRRYFQQLDRDMTKKLVERRILDSIVGFLDQHDIDTSELEERQTAILNNGLIISGGKFEAESVVVGAGAQSWISKITQMVGADDKKGDGK